MAQMFEAMLLGPWRSRQADLLFMKVLIEAGKVKPVIDRCYPLRNVADAICYLEAGHAKGKVVITVERSDLEPAGSNIR